MLKSFTIGWNGFMIDCERYEGDDCQCLHLNEMQGCDPTLVTYAKVPVHKIEQLSHVLLTCNAGHFFNLLYQAWNKADSFNMRRLAIAFPDFTLAALHSIGHFSKFEI